MKQNFPLIAAAVALALANALAEPSAEATDLCVSPGERVCVPELPVRSDNLETERENPVVASTKVEMAPPPAPMPPGRGMTYAMAMPDQIFRNDSWIRSGLPAEYRNPALLDLIPPGNAHKEMLTMLNIAVGQEWEIYSNIKRSWAPAEVIAMAEGIVTLRYRDFPETCQVEASVMPQSPALFRVMKRAQ
jgi:hypothetical protein